MVLHSMGEISPTTHYGLKVDRAIKKFSLGTMIGSAESPRKSSEWARVSREGIVGGSVGILAESVSGLTPTRVVVNSGRLRAGSADGDGTPDDGPALRGWGPRAVGAFDAECDRLAPLCRPAGLTLALAPQADEVLSDVPTCLGFLRRYESSPFEIVLNPAELLTESMLPRAQEHLERVLDALGDHPRVSGMVLTNVMPAGAGVGACPVHRGAIPGGVMRTMAERVRSHGTVILLDHDLEEQLKWLGWIGG